MTTCSRCGTETAPEDFALRASVTKGLVSRSWCKACDVPKMLSKEETRRKALMQRYKLTPDQFTALGEAQQWLCAICSVSIFDMPYIDHNHATKAVRGLLCLHCNVGLGHFYDSVTRLQSAIAYLDTHSGGNDAESEAATSKVH